MLNVDCSLRNIIGLFLILLISLLPSCGVITAIDGSSEEEMKLHNTSKQTLYRESVQLRSELNDLSVKLEDEAMQKEELRSINEQLQDEVINLSSAVENLKEENAKVKMLSKKVKQLSTRVKVLSGTGSLDSAKALSERVEMYGLQVERIALALRSNFEETVIYYAPQFDDVANNLAESFGGSCRVTAISWNSIYDLIVVSGLNP